MSQRLKRWEREEVTQISASWVDENCRHRVTDRDLELGRLLVKRRLLRRDQVEILHPGFRGLSQSAAVVNRRLRILFDCHFIDRAFPRVMPGAGSSQAVISIDRAGAHLLDEPFKRVIKHQKDRLGNIERILPADYKHTLGVNDFECSLVLGSERHGCELLRWRVEHQNLRRFNYNGDQQLRPDGFGIVRLANGKGRAFFVEYDTGSEDIRSRRRFKKLEAKFKAYAAFKSSGAWTQEDWAQSLKKFPALVFLTEDKKRVEPLREIMKTLGIRGVVEHFSNRDRVLDALLT